MNLYKIVIVVISIALISGCGNPKSFSKVKKGDLYPEFYKKPPKSVLVLPARNVTSSVTATDNFRTSITKPLAEKGFYVFPVTLVDSFFKQENLSEAEVIWAIPPSKLKEGFGADAILYVDINAWDTSYKVLNSSVDVGLSFSLIDTDTGRELWSNNSYAYSYSGADGNDGIAGLIAGMIAVAINTGTDYAKLARVANYNAVAGMPNGPYSNNYKTDINWPSFVGTNGELDGDRVYVSEWFIKGVDKEEKVTLKTRHYIKGYHAYSSNNVDDFIHNGYQNYYITQEINGSKILRNRFFRYEAAKPYLLLDNNKVFVQIDSDGTIPYSEENDRYYFLVDEVQRLEKP
jgi:hypothetical protein